MGPVTVPLSLRNFLIMIAKNAVNASVLSAVQILHDPADNNLHNWHGIKGVLWMVGSAVLAREGTILIPKILRWSTTNGNGGMIMKSIVAFALLLFSALSLHAQTPAGYPFAVSGSYSASSGNATNNGMQNTLEWAMSSHAPNGWGVRADIFGLNKPAQTMLQLAEGQYKVQAQSLFKTKQAQLLNVSFGIHAGLGALKSPTGTMSFAAGAGLSADYKVSSFFYVRVLDLTYAYSRGLGNNGVALGNYVTAGAGIGFNF